MIKKGKSISKKIIGCGIFLILSLVMSIGIVVSLLSGNIGSYGSREIPEAVKQWEPQITKELEKYGRAEHINLLLAIVARESGGTSSLDIMQASESLGYPPNTITDPLYSIEVGVAYFDEVMTEAENADVDIDTAIQAYNMGNGYIDFVAENGGEHSNELAQQFSNQMKIQLGWNVYGDPNYVDNVKQYLGEYSSSESVGKATTFGILQHPYYGQEGQFVVTSEFSPARVNPETGVLQPHNGIDLAPYGGRNIPITSSGEGVVIYNDYSSGGGWMIIIRHTEYTGDNGQMLHTSYLHLSQKSPLGVGQEVDKGQFIGNTGTTGISTGVHLHFEIHEGHGNPVNPRKYLDF